VKAEPISPAFSTPAAAVGWGSGLTIDTASVDQIMALVSGALASARMLPNNPLTPQAPPPQAPSEAPPGKCSQLLAGGTVYSLIPFRTYVSTREYPDESVFDSLGGNGD
jgi:hypothetical protein